MTPEPTPVIDTHVHVWDKAAPWMSWLADRPASWEPVRRDFGWRDLRGVLDLAGVAEMILVQAGMTPLETLRLLRLAADQPTVAGVVGWATLTSPEAASRDLDSFRGPGSEKLVGIRNNHGWEPDGDVLATPDALDACRVLADRGLTLDLHFADDRQLPLALRLAEQLPGLTCVIDHLGKPRLGDRTAFASWSRSMKHLSDLPNVYVKYSGWATFVHRTVASDVRPYIDAVLDFFGSGRVMYGGNWPVALVSGSYQDTYRATLDAVADRSAAELADILYRTAIDCYLTKPH